MRHQGKDSGSHSHRRLGDWLLKGFALSAGYTYIMPQDNLPVSALPAWAKLNNIILNEVSISPMAGDKGLGVIGSGRNPEGRVLILVPGDLILSLENVWTFAKSDHHLHEVLESVGEYSRVP